jgi:hypothetical protein
MLKEGDMKYLDKIFKPCVIEEDFSQGEWKCGKYININSNFELIPNKEKCKFYAAHLNSIKRNYKFVCKKNIFNKLPLDVENVVFSFIKEPLVSYKMIYKYWEQKYIVILESWKNDHYCDNFFETEPPDYFSNYNKITKINNMLFLIKSSSFD